MDVTINVGDEVRIYGDDDWFHTGRVTEVDDDNVEVDFADWVQRYARKDVREAWPEDGSYQRVLIPWAPGEIIEDYREDA